jgi:hypothetical protein
MDIFRQAAHKAELATEMDVEEVSDNSETVVDTKATKANNRKKSGEKESHRHFDDRHVDDLLHAITVTRSPHVLITEKNDASANWSLQDFSDSLIAKNAVEGIYDTAYSYHLTSQAMQATVLDTHPRLVEEFVGINAHSLKHCPSAISDGTRTLKKGELVLASKKVLRRLSPHHPMTSYFTRKSQLRRQTKSKTSTANGVSELGWATLRRIVTVELVSASTTADMDQSNPCYVYHTEAVHPWELFDDFRMESLVRYPMDINYLSYSMTPDSPLVECSDTSFGYYHTESGDLNYNFGTSYTTGCVSYAKTLPG